jgi:hypothetical protein
MIDCGAIASGKAKSIAAIYIKNNARIKIN